MSLVMRRGSSGNAEYQERRWRLVATEILGTSVILAIYFLLRGLRPEDTDSSVARSLHLIRFEKQIGIFEEVRLQELFLQYDWLMTIANFVYAWGHYPVLLAIALWLVVKDPVRFRFVRNVMLVSAVIGIVTYWLWPAAPPRLMELHGYDFGFTDTVHGATSNVNYFQPGPFVNDYAALPSFHFGWIALASAAIWVNTEHRWVRIAAVAMSVVMWWAITVTGNHFFFDMVFGGLVVALSWFFVGALSQADLGARLRALRTGEPLPPPNH
ncbi:MAG: phosphatase PAP2 family protein [Dehalococcoidia bacterium]|nr:phosphatase PAP2 family protein [Dehalococcoidia bacterium]